jgi:hypothetical protein
MRGQMTHPDPDVLAEFRAGLGTGRRRARIASHLASCERCTGLSDQLGEIPALLAAVPAPAMPDAVAQRLENVLAAEVAQRDSSERTVGDPAHDRAHDPAHDRADHRAHDRAHQGARHRARSPRPHRHWDFRLVALRVLAPAAGVLVLAAGGYGLSRIGGGSTSSVAAGSAASSAASAASRAQAGPAAVPSSATTSRPEAAPLEPAARFGVVTSATDYRRATLPKQLKGELQRYARPAAGNEQSVQELAPGPVKECVLRVTAGISPVSLVLVEKAYYQGQPANVIVAARGDHDAAWVTTPACSAGSDYVLDTTTLPGTSAS